LARPETAAGATVDSSTSSPLVSEGRARGIERLLAEPLAAAGYEIVRVLFSGNRSPKLQVMLERKDLATIVVDDCARASRLIEAILDVEDPVAGSYVLEVSSPGIDRPLTRPLDFDRFAGFEARIELRQPLDGRRRYRGRLLGLDGDKVRLAMEGAEEVSLPFGDVIKAKLVLTDELIAAGRGSG
jgi:ribosome maturation factor RimP